MNSIQKWDSPNLQPGHFKDTYPVELFISFSSQLHPTLFERKRAPIIISELIGYTRFNIKEIRIFNLRVPQHLLRNNIIGVNIAVIMTSGIWIVNFILPGSVIKHMV